LQRRTRRKKKQIPKDAFMRKDDRGGKEQVCGVGPTLGGVTPKGRQQIRAQRDYGAEFPNGPTSWKKMLKRG